MGHSRAEDTDTVTVAKGGSAALRMGRTPCGYNEAVPYFLRRTLPVFMCLDCKTDKPGEKSLKGDFSPGSGSPGDPLPRPAPRSCTNR